MANIVGETIREEIDFRGWSVVELARRSEIDVVVLHQILNGARPVTETTSRLLGQAFGNSDKFFLNLQNGEK